MRSSISSRQSSTRDEVQSSPPRKRISIPQQHQQSQAREKSEFSSFTEELILIASPKQATKTSSTTILTNKTAKQRKEDDQKLAHLNSQKFNKDFRTDLTRLEQEEKSNNSAKYNMRHVFAPFVMLLPSVDDSESDSNSNDDDEEYLLRTPTPLRQSQKQKQNKSSSSASKVSGKRRQRDEEDDKDETSTSSVNIFSSILPKNVAIFCRCPSTCVNLVPRKKRQNYKLDQAPEYNVTEIEQHHTLKELHKHKMIPHQAPLPCQTRISCGFCTRQAIANISAKRLAREWLQCPGGGGGDSKDDDGCCCTKAASTELEEDESIGGLRKSLCRQCVMDILDDPRYYRSVDDWRKIRTMMMMEEVGNSSS